MSRAQLSTIFGTSNLFQSLWNYILSNLLFLMTKNRPLQVEINKKKIHGTLDMWHMTRDKWHLTCDTGNMTHGLVWWTLWENLLVHSSYGLEIIEKLHATPDTWHMTCDTWQVLSKCIINPPANIKLFGYFQTCLSSVKTFCHWFTAFR